MRIKTEGKLLSISFIFIVLICSISLSLTIFLRATDKYKVLCFLPLTFGFFSLIFCECYLLVGKSIAVTLLIAIMCFRSVFIPMLMSFCVNASISTVDTKSKLPYAVFLLIYEQLAIFGTIYYYIPKIKKCIFNKSINEYHISEIHLKWFTRIAAILALVVVFLLISYPLLAVSYDIGIFSNTDINIELGNRRIHIDEMVPKIPRYLFEVFAELLRWMIPIIVSLKLYLSKLKNWFKVILSMGIAVCAALFVSDTVATSLFIVIANFFLTYRLYKGNGSSLVVISSIGVVIVAVLALFVKSFGSGLETADISNITGTLQAYFAGPDNVAIAAMINEPVTISQILGDTFGFIPFVMYFFQNLPNTRELFNFAFWGKTGIETQIIPMISQGARYFTPIFAPVFTIFIVRLALVWEKRAYEKHELVNCIILIIASVCFAMSVGMYSASLVLQLFFNYVFPLIFLYHFISDVFSIKR